MNRGKELAERGYVQISSKFRRVARLEGTSGIEALRACDPELAQRFLDNAERQATMMYLRVHATDVEELTPEEFTEFKKAGGDTA